MADGSCESPRLVRHSAHLRKHVCVANKTFGCDSPTQMWVSGGCSGLFRQPTGHALACGFPGMRNSSRFRYHCEVPSAHRLMAPESLGSLASCSCQNGLSSNPTDCGRPPINASIGCMGGARGGPSAACCRYDAELGCPIGFTPCAWHGKERIAWLHPPKTGTSLLLSLGALANRSLLDELAKEKQPLRSLKRGGGTQWDSFFRTYPHERWFRGSSVFWLDGLSHAGLSDAAWEEFRGRLFGMFRDPRERGWSAYNEFVAEPSRRLRFPPSAYARCIAGQQVGMLTGQVSTRPFGALHCHLLLPNETGCRHGCGDFVPDMQLAKQRLDGFAFVGLTEEWLLSICLFSTAFRLPCSSAFLLDTRNASEKPLHTRCAPGEYGGDLSWTPPAEYRSAENAAVFADPHELRFHGWVRERFARDLARYGLSREYCAANVCPADG